MYNTGNPIGSTSPKDFSDNAEIADRYVNDVVNETTLDRFGRSRLTIHGIEKKADTVFASVGFFPPVDYTTGLSVDSRNFTVTYNGVVYAAQPSAVPFTTGAWDDAQWYPIQNVLNQKNLLVFDTYAAASAAAATLPDGQEIEAPDAQGKLSRYRVQSGSLVFQRLSEDAGYTNYTPAGVGAVARTVQAKLRERVSVKDFGAKGDGATDDTAAIQACIDAVIAAGGGVVYFPASQSHYRITAPLLVDYSGVYYASNRFSKKVHFIGDGSTSTYIVPDSGAFASIYVKGNATDNAAYFKLQGIRLSSIAPSGNTGLLTDKVAYLVLDDVIIEVFETGWSAIDTEQIGVYDTEIRYNTIGVTGQTGTMTSPNSWSFYNTMIAGNTKGGAYIQNANAFNYNGGSVQYNGFIGAGVNGYGVQLIEAGNGYGTIGFTNMAFEGNGGLGDFVSGQVTYPCTVSFDNVSFMRTANFFSATVTGAANNGSGAIRLAVNSTAPLVGKPKVFVYGVAGTTEANNAVPWSFTVVDGTHIDLIGSTFTNAYISGGKISIVGFGTNNILADGTAAGCVYSLTNCTLKNASFYVESATRPTIALLNVNAKISDDGTNYFTSSAEKLTYTEDQRIGDDGSAWASYVPTATAAGGTFTATAVGKTKKIGKTVFFEATITTTSYAATPTAPLTVSLPFQVASSSVLPVFNNTTTTNSSGIATVGTNTVRIWKDTAFPINANGQTLVVSGSYETI